jgi:hypothetical protein
MLHGADIDGERLFFTQPTQPTTVFVDTDKEAFGPDLTLLDDAKKKWEESHRTNGFTTTRTNVFAMRGSKLAMTP